MLISFICFLFLFAAIGLSSAKFSRGTKADYYVASGQVPPWLVGLSAVATNNSGYMFIGVIGYTYATGLASIWLMIGWLAGDFLASLYIHKRLNQATKQHSEVSYAGVLSQWAGGHSQLQRLIGIVSLLFLLAYAAAQLVAGSKALHVLLGWPLWSGAVAGAVLVSLYCFVGGIRASIWTDAAQSIVMVAAMAMLLIFALSDLGGAQASWQEMGQVDGFLEWFPKELAFPGALGMGLFLLSWLVAGLSVIGQPHIMVRFMALDNSANMRKAKAWYYLWFTLFYCMATGVGLLSRIYLPDVTSFDPELALPVMAQQLFSPFFVGLVLAGIFAATMSTADSLLLSCSAAVTHDILPQKTEKTGLLKLTTIAITGIALAIALSNNQSVFSLVIMAWSGLASAFAPLLIFLCLGKKPSQTAAVVAVITGFAVALSWRFAGLHQAVYEGLPGIVAGLVVLFSAQTVVGRPR